jgi:hypothetical protein
MNDIVYAELVRDITRRSGREKSPQCMKDPEAEESYLSLSLSVSLIATPVPPTWLSPS